MAYGYFSLWPFLLVAVFVVAVFACGRFRCGRFCLWPFLFVAVFVVANNKFVRDYMVGLWYQH